MKLVKRITALLCSAMLAVGGLSVPVTAADGAEEIIVPSGDGVTNPAASIEIIDTAANGNFYVYSYAGENKDDLVFPTDYPYYDTVHTVTVKVTGVNPDQECDDNIVFYSGNVCDIKTVEQGKTGENEWSCTVTLAGHDGPAPYTVVSSSNVRAYFMVRALTVPAKVSLNYDKVSIPVGEIRKLTSSPATGTWSSSDTSVATVSSSGVVTGVSDGVADITLTYKGYGQTLTGTCRVTVGKGAAPSDTADPADKGGNTTVIPPVTDNNSANEKPAVVKKVTKGASYTAGSGVARAKYKVTSTSKRTVTYTTCVSSKNKATVPATVKLADGKTYTVTKIASGAFKSVKKVKTVTVKAKKLTKKNVKNCFKGSKVTKLKTVKYSSYKKIFTKANCGKTVKIKKI